MFLKTLVSALLFVLAATGTASAQTDDTPRIEVGAQFSSITITAPGEFPDISSFGGSAFRTEPGVGGRFTYNITDYIAAEAEVNY